MKQQLEFCTRLDFLRLFFLFKGGDEKMTDDPKLHDRVRIVLTEKHFKEDNRQPTSEQLHNYQTGTVCKIHPKDDYGHGTYDVKLDDGGTVVYYLSSEDLELLLEDSS